MEVTLTLRQGTAQARRIRLRSPETIVGRQKGCDVRIPSSEVSRRHCLLSFANGQLTVEDLDSINGTFLNQERVRGRAVVRSGDRLKIGPVTFTVDYPMSPRVGAQPSAAANPTAPAQQAPTRTARPLAGRKSDDPIPLVDDEPRTPPQPRGKPLDAPIPLASDPIPLQEDPVLEEIPNIDFDDSGPLHLPEGEDFRDFLSQMDK